MWYVGIDNARCEYLIAEGKDSYEALGGFGAVAFVSNTLDECLSFIEKYREETKHYRVYYHWRDNRFIIAEADDLTPVLTDGWELEATFQDYKEAEEYIERRKKKSVHYTVYQNIETGRYFYEENYDGAGKPYSERPAFCSYVFTTYDEHEARQFIDEMNEESGQYANY